MNTSPRSLHLPASPRAFTLTELLAVIAVVGLLASLLIPALSTMRNRAAAATCASNLRQCASVLMQYAQDNKQQIPTRWRQSSKWYGWNSFLQKSGYLDMNTKVGTPIGRRFYSCPLGYNDPVLSTSDSQCYGINIDAWGPDGRTKADLGEQALTDSSGATYYIQSLSLASIPRLSTFVLLADSFNKLSFDNSDGKSALQKAIFGEPSSNLWMRHSHGLNALMADGHVERLTPDTIDEYLSPSMPGGYHE